MDEIEIFLEDVPSFDTYHADLKTRPAIEMNLKIVGEAMNRILKKNPAISLQDARKNVETRNRIIHGYDSVSDEIIWSIITTNLPNLKNKIKQFLKT